MQWLKVGLDVSCVTSVLSSVIAQCIVFGRPFVKRSALCYHPVCLYCLLCLWHWCIVAKRLDGSRWNLACRYRPRPWPHCFRWGPSSPKRAEPQIFSAHICCGQMAAWIKMPLSMEVGLGPGDFVLDYRLQKIAPRIHGNSPFYLKNQKKISGEGHSPTPHSQLP